MDIARLYTRDPALMQINPNAQRRGTAGSGPASSHMNESGRLSVQFCNSLRTQVSIPRQSRGL